MAAALALLAGTMTISAAVAAASPLRKCSFATPLDVPYYWEPQCNLTMPGCWADSANIECRFCGAVTGVPCPPAEVVGAHNESVAALPNGTQAAVPPAARGGGHFLAPNTSTGLPGPAESHHECRFDNPPVTPYYWEPQCRMGIVGCNADGRNVKCRFCGEGAYATIPCSPLTTQCSFPNEPRTPYYWDENCTMGIAGCNADGIHAQCRFCVQRPFNQVDCPASLRVTPGRCSFPGLEPLTPYFWDPTCEFGKLGCWADGLHAECRWCGVGAYEDIPCPP